MLKLGHIIYSNCFLPHAGIRTGAVDYPFQMIDGVPTELNRLLVEGKIDVSPSSSIEYAVNAGKYLILPGMSISSRTRVMSILLESKVPIEELDKRAVALTTASATSVVLLRVILEIFFGVNPDFRQYEQGKEDPYQQADAVLTIGDLALKRAAAPTFPHAYDLGELWHRKTGLPFVFALWQVNYRKSLDRDLARIYSILKASKDYGLAHVHELARDHAAEFGIPADILERYWKVLSYDFGPDEQKGLLTYYGYAAELGVISSVPDLCFWTEGAR
ncbi:MAG: menaquinone biosynthesis protein [Nitrospiraceae bacterium]|nr:menaquinone biosynthesis protein [Nitrospiraceae bacterium]